jgi:hypothetical protein
MGACTDKRRLMASGQLLVTIHPAIAARLVVALFKVTSTW